MLRVFQNDILDPQRFVITLELVPGRESTGRSVDTVMGIAADAFADGRISAVSITDNPGGNPSLGPDILGSEIFKIGMDVIVHFTCRDANRLGLESRALNLALMGMKNILALNGDYVGQGFGGQGAPVFDLDSVNLQILLAVLSQRLLSSGDPDGFYSGCAVSPFKYTEPESFAQYAKLCRKAAVGSRFVITQLGYDARKFEELRRVQQFMGIDLPTLGSVYVLTPTAARIMHQGKVPGAIVTDSLLAAVTAEWQDKETGRKAAIERAARLGAVLKGLGYRGMHIGGIHRSFDIVGRIIDRLGQIERNWKDFVSDFQFSPQNGFYAFSQTGPTSDHRWAYGQTPVRLPVTEKILFRLLHASHRQLFNFDSPSAPWLAKACRLLDQGNLGPLLMRITEDPLKKMLLGCLRCGDCGIQHVGFICPESGCPKHIRNGACGGSRNGMCEVHPDRYCVWYRAYRRLASVGRVEELTQGCIPPRMWELNHTSSWLNFHLGRDHHKNNNDLVRYCRTRCCNLDPSGPSGKG
jgi:methylenetetrahydrofolate reductase (NADPH)